MTRSARPTWEGSAVLGLTAAIGLVAAASGNNLLYLVLGTLVALWGLEIVLGSWNMRGVDAVRRLPGELVADSDAGGRLIVRNRRRWLPAVSIRVRDQGTGAEAQLREVAAGSNSGGPAVWRFPHRGLVQLQALEVSSPFPLGWVDRRLVLPAPAEVIVYPRPSRTGARAQAGEESGAGRDAEASRGGSGDFAGLRPYQPGDRLGSVHWPTTARAGELMVVQRSGEAEPTVRVVVQQTPVDAWEGEISRAAGEVIRGFSRGWRVAMELPSAFGEPGRVLPAHGGSHWRRTLLEALAKLPEAR